jgi:Fe2+ or Zn2+ uptake regulation protein
METKKMTPEIASEMERQFYAYWRSIRTNRSTQRVAVCLGFLRMTKPVSATDLLYVVKQEDVTVSLGAVWTTLKLMVACGLAREMPGPRRGTLFAHVETVAACGHRHLVCKDCGAAIDPQAP